ncbi:MAG: hypothetical protein ACD_79C00668G0002 [uncultured bacterium]|nr:MAG: hypothetical protein ACD_79C00668G0002 [uncultured bacterium]
MNFLTANIALRFLFSRKREKFISINAVLAIGSVALSVMVLVVVIGVMTGFGESLREKIMTMTPHIIIYSNTPLEESEEIINTIAKTSDVTSVNPYVLGNAVLEHNNKLYGIGLRSFENPNDQEIIGLKKYLKSGTSEIGRSEIIIGTEMAKNLNVNLDDLLTINSPRGIQDGEFPGYINMKIKGIYESGLYESDLNQAFVSLADAKLLYGFKNEVHGIGVAVKDFENAGKVKEKLLETLSNDYTVRTWIDNNKQFFSALRSEKNVMFILLTFAVLIASLNIISTLVMLVMEKFKDIGILKAIGFSKFKILKIFLLKGLIIGILGTFIGVLSGWLFVKNIDVMEDAVAKYTGYEVFPSDTYYFDKIPTKLTRDDIIKIILLSMFVSILASIYPAVKASNLSAIEALRYE